jgi:hypothetical protein
MLLNTHALKEQRTQFMLRQFRNNGSSLVEYSSGLMARTVTGAPWVVVRVFFVNLATASRNSQVLPVPGGSFIPDI